MSKSCSSSSGKCIGFWVALGAGFGVALGAIFGNVGLGVSLGAGAGLLLNVITQANGSCSTKSDQDDNQDG